MKDTIIRGNRTIVCIERKSSLAQYKYLKVDEQYRCNSLDQHWVAEHVLFKHSGFFICATNVSRAKTC